jgi:hypothetical protein
LSRHREGLIIVKAVPARVSRLGVNLKIEKTEFKARENKLLSDKISSWKKNTYWLTPAARAFALHYTQS